MQYSFQKNIMEGSLQQFIGEVEEKGVNAPIYQALRVRTSAMKNSGGISTATRLVGDQMWRTELAVN